MNLLFSSLAATIAYNALLVLDGACMHKCQHFDAVHSLFSDFMVEDVHALFYVFKSYNVTVITVFKQTEQIFGLFPRCLLSLLTLHCLEE